MRKGNKKLFLDRGKLIKMLNLRLNGFSVETLGIIFNCDHTSIGDQCRKYGIAPMNSVYPQAVNTRKVYDIKRSMSFIISSLPKETPIERINRGKSYAEYVAEAIARGNPEGKIMQFQRSYPHSWAYKIK